VHLSVCKYFCSFRIFSGLSVCQFIWLSICLSVHLFVNICKFPDPCQYIRLSVNLFVFPSVDHIFGSTYVCLSVCLLICLSISTSICPCVFLFICLSIYMFDCLSILHVPLFNVCLSIYPLVSSFHLCSCPFAKLSIC
jgi:hypothetical protein